MASNFQTYERRCPQTIRRRTEFLAEEDWIRRVIGKQDNKATASAERIDRALIGHFLNSQILFGL
jgi:hypothetical protein